MGDNLRIEYMFSDLIDELILSNDFGMLDDMDPAFLAEVLKRAILLLRSLRGVEKNG